MAQSGLPHTDAVQAINLLHRTTPEVFTWPCLPLRSFREHFQSIAGFPGLDFHSTTRRVSLERDTAEQQLDRLGLAYLRRNAAITALTREDAAGLLELLQAPERLQKSYAIASHLLGPISLSLQITDEHHRPVIYDPMLLESLVQYLALRVTWLTTRLSDLVGSDIIICLDEPLLAALNSPFSPIDWQYANTLLDQVFAGTRGCRGLILDDLAAYQQDQASAAWLPLLETSVELILLRNFSAHHQVVLSMAELLPDFLSRPGVMAWGLIPADAATLAAETAETLAARFEQLVAQLTAAGVSREQLLQASLISTSGRLEHLPVAAAERALQLCADVSALLRARYGLTNDE